MNHKSNTYLPVELYHWAGMPSDNFLIIEDIIKENPTYISQVNTAGDTALFISIKSNNYKISESLINSGLICLLDKVPIGKDIYESYLTFALNEEREGIGVLLANKFPELLDISNSNNQFVEHLIFNNLQLLFFDFLIDTNYNFEKILVKDFFDKNAIDYLIENFSINELAVQYIFDVLLDKLRPSSILEIKKYVNCKEFPSEFLKIKHYICSCTNI